MTLPPAIHTYLFAVQSKYATGTATEHTYRADLESLLVALCQHIDPPMKEARGNHSRIKPDFVITKDKLPIGYIECKDIKTGIWDDKDTTAQIQKYFKHNLGGNFIPTDYIEFRFYQEGEHTQTVRLAELPLPLGERVGVRGTDTSSALMDTSL